MCIQQTIYLHTNVNKMPVIEIVSKEERELWSARKAELTEHASYKTKQQYFPKNMDEWEEKGKEIERRYRQELLSLNKQRKEKERQNEEEERQKEEEERKKERKRLIRRTIQKAKNMSTRFSLRQAAQALLELKTPRVV